MDLHLLETPTAISNALQTSAECPPLDLSPYPISLQSAVPLPELHQPRPSLHGQQTHDAIDLGSDSGQVSTRPDFIHVNNTSDSARVNVGPPSDRVNTEPNTAQADFVIHKIKAWAPELLASEIDRRVQAYKKSRARWCTPPAHLAVVNNDPFVDAYCLIKAELASCRPDDRVSEFCGTHVHVGALLRGKHYKRAARLSQIIADMLRTLRPSERLPSVTTMAMMWLHWCLWTWLIKPSIESFKRLPETMRPTRLQISTRHTLAIDFIVSPSLRGYLCQNAPHGSRRLPSMFRGVLCNGPKTALHALQRNSVTQMLDLTPECRARAVHAENWLLNAGGSERTQDDLPQAKEQRIHDEADEPMILSFSNSDTGP